MTVVVTRDVADRFRGFLASCALEIAPGVYTAPKMSRAVRDRVWAVMKEWFEELGGGCIVMTWLEGLAPGGQQIAILGSPPCELFECNEVFLARKRSQ
ncbi:MAG TPA: type I-E CRISPR-associated endoribonuclease Cas2e [Candidatus Binataceae bacterium]|nr:type I-E CRISPR-associated endoribonuclease Cas2e [Candidatus Binataceae bacterium]